jgi:CRISPR/Cas system-associated endonuclease Cas1
MNQLLINIAKRLVCKAIKLNTEEYNIQVSYKYINRNAIDVVIFNETNCRSYVFYDNSLYSNKHYIEQYKTILKKIRSKELWCKL